MSDRDLIVLRHDKTLHPSAWVPLLEGRWFDLNTSPVKIDCVRVPILGNTAVAEPTGRFEVAEDGAVAEVWEIRLADS